MLDYPNESARTRRGRERPSPAKRRERFRERPTAQARGRAIARRLGRVSGAAIGYGCIFLVLAGYFIWICLQMAGHAVGGATLVGAIFGAEVIGVGAAAGALALARRGKR